MIWINNAKVLSRGRNPTFKDNIKGHMVLDYDLWRVMKMIQKKITIPLCWEKVDSCIEIRVYADGATHNGDDFSIRLNMCADAWAETVRLDTNGARDNMHDNILYEEGQVMVRLKDHRLIYRDIVGQVNTISQRQG